jgi:hypothetical protein
MADAAAKKAVAIPEAKRELVKVHVKFTVNTPDGLRRIFFELSKNNTDGGVVQWSIHFQLLERARKSEAFGDPLVDLEVDVDTKLNSKAAAMADNGMTPSQAAFISGPGSDIVKTNIATNPDKANAAVETTLKK